MRPGERRGARPAARRSAAGEETRARILDAAEQLVVSEGFSRCTVEKLAERAGVSRMTVYYQFGSKREVLESLFDSLAARGRIDRLRDAFGREDARDALREFIAVFCGFWESNRDVIRRLRGWSAVESGKGGVGHERDHWRRKGLEKLVGRLRAESGVPRERAVSDVIDLLHTLTSFETYDNLAREGRGEAEAAALLARLAFAALELD